MFNLVPFYNRSIFDDVDAMDDLWLDIPFSGFQLMPFGGQHPRRQQHIPRNWTAAVKLPGFKHNEVTWEWKKAASPAEEATGTGKIVVTARHESGEDFSELRRVVEVPENVNRATVQSDFTREGILVFKAQYKQQGQLQQQRAGGGIDQWCGFGGSLTEEMQTLQNAMRKMIEQSFPGSATTRFLKDETSGQHSMQVDFDVSGYKPEEVDVKFDQASGRITVEAKHDEASDDGGHSYKHLRREFTVPENAQIDAAKSAFVQPPGGNSSMLRLDIPCALQPAPALEKGASTSGSTIPLPIKKA